MPADLTSLWSNECASPAWLEQLDFSKMNYVRTNCNVCTCTEDNDAYNGTLNVKTMKKNKNCMCHKLSQKQQVSGWSGNLLTGMKIVRSIWQVRIRLKRQFNELSWMLMVVCLCRNEGAWGPGTEEAMLEIAERRFGVQKTTYRGTHTRSANCSE